MEKINFNPPILSICAGAPGTGKSVLALGYDSKRNKIGNGVLHFTNGMAYLDKDMFVNPDIQKRYGESYKDDRERAYRAMDVIAGCNLSLGTSVWIDATYATEVQNPLWAERYVLMTKQTGSRLKLIRCVATEEIIRNRLIERGYKRDIEKLENWEGFLKREPIRVYIPHGGREIERSDNLEKNVRDVLDFLRE